jgi:hypothetical protein
MQQDELELMNMYFNYAEAPIKEWLAEYLNKPVEEVFPDYKDKTDLIGFKIEDSYYDAYIVTMEDTDQLYINKKLLDKYENYQRSFDMLLMSVHNVFSAVVNTCADEYKDALKNMRAAYDAETCKFNLLYINAKAMELQTAMYARDQTLRYLIMNVSTTPEDAKNKMLEMVNKYETTIKSYNKDVLDEEEERCKKINESLKTNTKLFIVIEEKIEEIQTEESLQRLPTFGRMYDIEDESHIDKIKKEMHINE